MKRFSGLAVLLALWFIPFLVMAQITTEQFGTYINGLPPAVSVVPSDQFYVRQGGVSKQVPLSILLGGVTSWTNTPAVVANDCVAWTTTPGVVKDAGAPCGSGSVNSSGSVTAGDCVKFLNSTTIQDTGSPCSSGGVPGGINGQVQFNNSGSFGGYTAAQLTALMNTFTSTLSGAVPAPAGGQNTSGFFLGGDAAFHALPSGGTPGGTNGQVQVNNSGAFGGLTNTQLTADVNVFTATTSGAVPASGGSSTSLFLSQAGTFQTPAGGGNVSTSGTITTGNCAQWASATTLLATGAPCGGSSGGTNLGFVSITSYLTGPGGDGTCHALSSQFASIAAARAVYPFVDDLTQCIDWAATQQAVNVAYAANPGGAAATVYCPAGTYELSNPIFHDQATGGIKGSYAAWASGTTYANGANVTYNGIPWVSMGSGNIGNPPTSQALFPTQIMASFNGGGGIINQAGFPWAVVTISSASPAVVTVPSGGITISNGQGIVFFTQQFTNPNGGSTPALPSGINANQVYYVSNVTATTFNISATPGGALINTTSTGVGNLFYTPQVWQVQPVSSGTDFGNRVSFIGDEGLSSNGGCRFQTQYNWTTPVHFLSGQNGSLVKNVGVTGNAPQEDGTNTYTGARCTGPFSIAGSGNLASSPAGASVGTAGFALMSNGGGSRTKFENVGASRVSIGYWVGYGTNGQLTDSNTWEKSTASDGCVAIYFGQTQAFVNSVYDFTSNGVNTGIVGYTQEGAKVIGGNWSAGVSNAASFTLTGVSVVAGCGFLCITATVTNPDNYLQTPMCAYSAGQAYQAGAKYPNAWPFAGGCGYSNFVMNVPHWGLVGLLIVNYVPNYGAGTGAITFAVPASYYGIYQGTCCGSDLSTQIATVTKLYAAEGAITFFGDSQVDTIHIENNGTPTSAIVFGTQFFGGVRPAEMRNVYLNAEASDGAAGCCNNPIVGSPFNNDKFIAQWAAQQTAPLFNCTLGDCILDHLGGGFNGLGAPTAAYHGNLDRAMIATETATYIEGRHMFGSNDQNVATGSGGNNTGPLFDFSPQAFGDAFTATSPLVSPGTIGQLSGGYYAMGGSALGAGLWDNGANFVPSSAFSVNASNQQVDLGSLWRSRGWGQTPMWGVRPAPWANSCLLPSMASTLNGTLPTITHTSRLQDYLVVSNGGANYAVNDTITLAGGTATTRAVVTVTGVSSGVITSVRVQTSGTYTAEPAPGTSQFTQFSTSGSGSGATFTKAIFYVDYTIGYPLLWGGHIYKACNYTGVSATFSAPVANRYALTSAHNGWSYGQALTTTNVPNLLWTMDGASPFIYMNLEALELMFPGLVISLTGSGGCAGTQTFMVLEVKPSAGYVKVVRADTDGGPYVPSLAASGTSCTGTTIGQASYALFNPY